jgi:hypothetical protein
VKRLSRPRGAWWARAAAGGLLLAGCARDPRQAVLGEWHSAAGRMLFYPDGQVLMEQDSSASVARYEFTDKKLRRLRIRALAASPADYGVTVTRDSLVLCPAGAAECFRLARVAPARR